MEKVGTVPCRAEEAQLLQRVEKILDDSRLMPGALIPVLQTVQNLFGYLPEAALRRISERLGIPFSEVAGVVGFYSFFSTKPRGRYLIRVCLGTACYVRGGKDVLKALAKELGIGVGETTPDRMFSLDVGRCFGSCGLAPVVLVNDQVHQRVKAARIGELVKVYRSAEGEAQKGEQ